PVRPLDDESASDAGVSLAGTVEQALAAGERVIGGIGHRSSRQAEAAIQREQSMRLLVITRTASEQTDTEPGDTYGFRINAHDAVQAAVDAEFLVETLDAERVAIIHNDTDYGRGLAATLGQELTGRGAEIAIQIEVAEGQSRYENEITQLQSANADAIFYA